jgi:Ni,Fe-hydrogenase maturation factor
MNTFIKDDIVKVINLHSSISNCVGRVFKQREDGKVIVVIDGIDWKVNPSHLKLLKRKDTV